MKAEREIRKHMEDLRTCLNVPCNCAATGHSIECECGRRMMRATIDALAWVLGQNDHHDRLVEFMSASAARRRLGARL